MRTLVIDLCRRDLSSSEFVEPIATIVGEGARTVRYDRVGGPEVDAADAAVICGTALADEGYMEHLEAFDWLGTTGTPVLGVCAGMQVVALHHGARLVPGKEIGMVAVEPSMENPLVTAPMEVYGLHRHDLEDLGAFHVLAHSRRCVHAIGHRSRPLFGILFHPEVRRGGVVGRFLEHVKAHM